MTQKNTIEQFLSEQLSIWDKQFEQQLKKIGSDNSLASGLSGILLLEFILSLKSNSALHKERIILLRDKIVENLQKKYNPPNLWAGFLGALYVFEYMRSHDSDCISNEIVDFINETDSLLIEFCLKNQEKTHFDLIIGLTGIGAYALMRNDHDAAKRLYEAVEKGLLQKSTIGPHGLKWVTSPYFASIGLDNVESVNGYEDFGFAHGIPGVIGLLSGAISHNIHTDNTASILKQATEWMISQARTDLGECTYLSHSLSKSEKSRLAWCYGDLGVGLSLLYAAQALGDQVIEEFALEMLIRRFKGPEEDFMLYDSGLCHGHAGVWLIAKKINAICSNKNIELVSINSLTTILNSKDFSNEVDNRVGLLDGIAGVLAAFCASDISEQKPWDICFYCGF